MSKVGVVIVREVNATSRFKFYSILARTASLSPVTTVQPAASLIICGLNGMSSAVLSEIEIFPCIFAFVHYRTLLLLYLYNENNEQRKFEGSFKDYLFENISTKLTVRKSVK